MLHLHSLACRVVKRPQRGPGLIDGRTNSHRPLALVQVTLIDRLVSIDHRQANRATEGESVRRGTHVPDWPAIAADDLSVEHQWLRVVQEYLDEPSAGRAVLL